MEGVSRPEPDAGADEIGPSDDLDESDFLAYVVYPTLLALLFAMLSLPVVALSLDLTDTPDTGRWVGVLGTVLTNGKVLLTGDADSGPRAELYDPATGKFTPIAFEVAPGAAPSAQYKGQTFERTAPDTATLLKDGRVLLFEAGYLETYDPATGMFSPAGFISPPGQWNSPTATLLANGRVLFAGGSWLTDPNAFTYVVASAAALYDAVDGPQLIGSMSAARGGQTITLLTNGSVLIAGGGDEQGRRPLFRRVIQTVIG